MVRRVLAFLGRFLAVMLLGIMALVCAIVAITRSEPALIALLVCISSACVFIIRWITGFLDRPLPENEKNASFGAGGFLALAGTGLAVFYFIHIREPARKYPVREDLQISAGVLRPAIGHNLYLERRNSPSRHDGSGLFRGGRTRARSRPGLCVRCRHHAGDPRGLSPSTAA
jgi:hypothetical protein